jgi:hypothetical protein
MTTSWRGPSYYLVQNPMQKANACAHALPVGVTLIVPLPYRQEYRMVSFHFKMFGWNQNKTVHMWKLKKIGPAPLLPGSLAASPPPGVTYPCHGSPPARPHHLVAVGIGTFVNSKIYTI